MAIPFTAAFAATLSAAIDFALPPRCPGCGAVTDEDHAFCVACWQRLDFQSGPACATCGAPFDHEPDPGARCDRCLTATPALDGMRAAVSYADVPRRMALRLKHGRRPGLAVTIARRMERLAGPPDALLAPVPLHRWRIWSRGHNQSALIGRALARRTGLAFAPALLRRTRHTPMLRGLDRPARAAAVADAFMVTDGAAVSGRTILLIDDVFTTGATANACAAALKRAGAREVRLLCWARVPLERVGGDTDVDIMPPSNQPERYGAGGR